RSALAPECRAGAYRVRERSAQNPAAIQRSAHPTRQGMPREIHHVARAGLWLPPPPHQAQSLPARGNTCDLQAIRRIGVAELGKHSRAPETALDSVDDQRARGAREKVLGAAALRQGPRSLQVLATPVEGRPAGPDQQGSPGQIWW